MNNLKSAFTGVLYTVMLILSCREPAAFSRIEYRIPSQININIEDLKAAFRSIKTDASGGLFIVVSVYSYSSGSEKISFSGGENIKTVTSDGIIKVLIKVMDDKKIIRAEFAEGRGNNKEELFSNLEKDVRLKLDQGK